MSGPSGQSSEPQRSNHPLPPAPGPRTLTVAGHELTVFVEWPPLLEAMLGDIGRAQKRVWVETYIFSNDEGGRRFAEALQERARAGVDVRVHYDDVGSAMTPGGFFAELAAAGVQVHAYHTLLEGLKRFKPLTILNRRDHRKLLVVDDLAGYFGGMNIIDNAEPLRLAKPQRVPRERGWRDVHVRLAGPQQAQLAESFERSWCRAHGRRRARLPRAALRAELRQVAGGHGAEESIHFFDSGPPGPMSRAARVYTRMIQRAQRQITLAMAYFIPVGGVLRALLAARKRGVGVRVIVPGTSDVPLVQYATAYLYDRLIRRGLRIYERRQRMLHSKVMIVDELYTLVGSANLDPRSLYINLEFLAVIRSPELARLMQEVCRFEMAHSRRITIADYRRIGRWQRFVNQLAWMLRWWL